MMSLAHIENESRLAAKRAKRQGLKPFPVFQEDIDEWKRAKYPKICFPYTGDARFRGWKEVERYLVDASGFGNENEPALTLRAFLDVIESGYGYAITEAGQFQIYITKYTDVSKKKGR